MLLFKQFVDVFDIVETVVDEKAKLGNNAQLIVHALAQFVADGFLVSRDVFDEFLGLFRGENAQIGRANAKVGRHAGARYRNHNAMHGARLTLKNKA